MHLTAAMFGAPYCPGPLLVAVLLPANKRLQLKHNSLRLTYSSAWDPSVQDNRVTLQLRDNIFLEQVFS